MHVVDPAVTGPMSTEVAVTVPEYSLAPVHVTDALSSDVVGESGRTYVRTARPASEDSATEVAAAGTEWTTTVTVTVEVSASVTQQNHCPAAAATVCPAVPETVEVPRRQENELLPAAIEIDAFPPVRPVDSAGCGRECTTTDCPQAPVIVPRTPRERHFQKPAAPLIVASPGAAPVAVTVSPSDAQDTSHEVVSAPSSPTRTTTEPAAACHGVSAGAAGAGTPLNTGGAVRSGLVMEERERVSRTAPWTKLFADVHGEGAAAQRTVPDASRTSTTPPGSLSSHRRCVPAAIPLSAGGCDQVTAEAVLCVTAAGSGALSVMTTEWNVSSVGVPRLSGTRNRPTTCIESGPDHWIPSGDLLYPHTPTCWPVFVTDA